MGWIIVNGKNKGFTLMEMMIVIAVILLIAGISTIRHKRTVERGREVALHTTLFNIRQALDMFYEDRGYYPDSIEMLTTNGYLRSMPKDAITQRTDTWIIIYEDNVLENSNSLNSLGIYDVKSGAEGVGLDGTPYASW